MMKERQSYSALHLQELFMCLCISAKHCSTWLTQFLPLEFTNHFKQSNAYSYRRSDIVFNLQTNHMSLRRIINKQCSGVVCRLPRELGAYTNSVYQAFFPPSLHEILGNEASLLSSGKNLGFKGIYFNLNLLFNEDVWLINGIAHLAG